MMNITELRDELEESLICDAVDVFFDGYPVERYTWVAFREGFLFCFNEDKNLVRTYPASAIQYTVPVFNA